MKLVLDTNVLVAGMIHASGPPGRIVDQIRGGSLTPVVDDRIVAECTTVLRRPRFKTYFSDSQVRDILEFIRTDAERVVAGAVAESLPDRADIPFLEVALSADVPLVAGNLRDFPEHLRQGATVLSPAEFVGTLSAGR